MNKKDEIYVTHDGMLMVNGKEYIESQCKIKKIDDIEHVYKVTFKEFDRKEFNKKVAFISKKIESKLNKEELIIELVQKKAVNEINKLYDLLNTTKKPTIKKQNGCLGIKIGSGKSKTGGGYVQLID